jgi:hypothetical protein
MSFVVSKDAGEGKPPLFLRALCGDGAPIWEPLAANVLQYPTEAEAIAVIDSNDQLMGCIVLPYDESMNVSNEAFPRKDGKYDFT